MSAADLSGRAGVHELHRIEAAIVLDALNAVAPAVIAAAASTIDDSRGAGRAPARRLGRLAARRARRSHRAAPRFRGATVRRPRPGSPRARAGAGAGRCVRGGRRRDVRHRSHRRRSHRRRPRRPHRRARHAGVGRCVSGRLLTEKPRRAVKIGGFAPVRYVACNRSRPRPNPSPACSQCGTALAPPSGSATFVYGVGAVGYQSCDTCGAKWRYLWQDPPGAGGGLNRLPFLLVGAVDRGAARLGAFAFVALVHRPTSRRRLPPPPRPLLRPTARPPRPPARCPLPTGADFSQIVTPVADARSPLMQYLLTTALSSAQYEVNTRVQTFVNQASQSVDALQKARWPTRRGRRCSPTRRRGSAVHQRPRSGAQYGLLYSTSFTEKLTADVGTINRYETAARSKLGLSS